MSWRIPLVIYAPAARRGGALTILLDVLHQLITDQRRAIVIVHPDAVDKIPTSALLDIQPLAKASRLRRLTEDFSIAPRMVKDFCPDGARIICLSNRALRLDKKYIQHVFVHNPFAISCKAPHSLRWTRSALFYTVVYPRILAANFRRDFFYHVQRPSLKIALHRNYKAISKVSVIPPVVSETFAKAATQALEQHIPKEPILFCPVAANPHKNLIILAKAAPLIAQYDLRIVVTVTPDAWLAQTQCSVPDNVECIGYITTQRMAALYVSSQAMIFPSLLETAGLPLLEAQRCNCPVIASDLDFTHDLLGSYNQLTVFDPNNEHSLAEAVGKLINQTAATNFIDVIT